MPDALSTPEPRLSKPRIALLGAGAAGLAAVAVIGGGVAFASGGSHPSAASKTTTTTAAAKDTAVTAATAAPSAAPSGAPSTRPTGAPPQGQKGGPGGHGGPGGGGRPGGGGPGGGPGGRVLHGEFLTNTGTDAAPVYTTEDEQSGTVTAVSATSLTLVSTDKYSETYVLTSSTKYGRDGKASDIAVGDKVQVRATVASGTATATNVDEHTDQPKPSASASPTS